MSNPHQNPEEFSQNIQNIADLIVATGKGWVIHKELVTFEGTVSANKQYAYIVLRNYIGSKILVGEFGTEAIYPNIGSGDSEARSAWTKKLIKIWNRSRPSGNVYLGGIQILFVLDPAHDFSYSEPIDSIEFYPESCCGFFYNISKMQSIWHNIGYLFNFMQDTILQFGVSQDAIWYCANDKDINTSFINTRVNMVGGKIFPNPESSNPLSKYGVITADTLSNYLHFPIKETSGSYFMGAFCCTQDGRWVGAYPTHDGSGDARLFSTLIAYQSNPITAGATDYSLHDLTTNTTRWGHGIVALINNNPSVGITNGSNVLGYIDPNAFRVTYSEVPALQTMDGGNLIHHKNGWVTGWSPTNPPIFTSGD